MHVSANAHRWANRAEIVGLKHLVTLGARGSWAEKRKKRHRTKVGPTTWKLAVLLAVLLNGKRFWKETERAPSAIDAWQRRREKNCCNCALLVEQVNRVRRANDVGSGGAQIGRLRLHPIDRAKLTRD